MLSGDVPQPNRARADHLHCPPALQFAHIGSSIGLGVGDEAQQTVARAVGKFPGGHLHWPADRDAGPCGAGERLAGVA